MNAKAIIPLIAGIAIAGFAGKLGFDRLSKAQGGEIKRTQVWTAAVDIPLGTAIDEAMLKAVKYPATAVPPGAFTEKEKLLGRVPRMAAPANLPILDAMLSPEGTQPGIIVPAGLRAVALKIDESSGVDNHLRPGAFVDVIGFFNSRNSKDTIARTIVENVQVAAVGERLSNVTAEEADPKKSSGPKKPPRAVTLFVKPDQVPTLHLAEQKGKIKLSMRGNDGSTESMSGLVVSDRDVIGEEAPQDASAQDPGWLEKMLGTFTQREPHDSASSATSPTPVAPEPPKPAWTMVIVNGGERRVLGWKSMESIEPVEMMPMDASLFSNTAIAPLPMGVPPMTPPGATMPPGGVRGGTGLPPGVSPTPHDTPNSDPVNEPDPESPEPEELR